MQLVILDRDGVINEDSAAYIKSPEEWIPIPGSLEAIARIHRAGWRVVVATNQSGISRKLFDPDILVRIHEKMHRSVSDAGGLIDAIFFCPHGPHDNCNCRKPRPGLFLDIARRVRISLHGVPAIGDSLQDLHAARAAGAYPILVRTGKGGGTHSVCDTSITVPVYDNLARAVDDLLTIAPGIIQASDESVY
jgi:D-glycero-D-manno-heptose 1,7-bisphosphate phosphatase